MTNTTNDHSWLFTQLFSNWKKFEIIYVTILLLLQVGVYLIAPDSWIGMLSGVFGTIALVLRDFSTNRLVYVGSR